VQEKQEEFLGPFSLPNQRTQYFQTPVDFVRIRRPKPQPDKVGVLSAQTVYLPGRNTDVVVARFPK
jgi:hypothetical protein